MKYCPQCKMSRKYEFLKLNLEEEVPAWKVAELAEVHENTVYNWKQAFEKGSVSKPIGHPLPISKLAKYWVI